jgi:hypothetical protein
MFLSKTSILLLQVFVFALIVVFFLEYTVPTAKNIIESPMTIGTPVNLWGTIASYEKGIAIIANVFTIIGPFLGVLITYLFSKLIREDKNK